MVTGMVSSLISFYIWLWWNASCCN